MPAALADPLFQRLIDAYPPDRAYAPSDLAHDPMPSPVAHFLTKLLQRLLHLEAERLDLRPRSPWFETGHAEVEHARQALVKALVAHGHFPAAEWEAPLRQATTQVAAYLVRPVATLVNFVFQNGEDPASATVVERRLGYFNQHTYLLDGARLYLQQKQVSEISRVRFGEVLHHIDRRLTRDYDADAWLGLLAPVFDLAHRALQDASGVPVPLLRSFFEEKQAGDVVHRLAAHEVDTLDKAGLRRLLENVEESEDETVRPAPPAPAAEPSDEGGVPLWKQFQQDHSTPAHAARAASQHEQAAASASKPRWMQYRSESAAASSSESPAPEAPATPARRTPASEATTAVPSDLAALEQAVLGNAARNRDLFIRHLFNGSKDDYAAVLYRLAGTSDWTEATQIIADEVFRKHQVNIYSDPAVLFTDAVEARIKRRA